jgi:hypothetical protein
MSERIPWPAENARWVRQIRPADLTSRLLALSHLLATHAERFASQGRMLGFNWFI